MTEQGLVWGKLGAWVQNLKKHHFLLSTPCLQHPENDASLNFSPLGALLASLVPDLAGRLVRNQLLLSLGIWWSSDSRNTQKTGQNREILWRNDHQDLVADWPSRGKERDIFESWSDREDGGTLTGTGDRVRAYQLACDFVVLVSVVQHWPDLLFFVNILKLQYNVHREKCTYCKCGISKKWIKPLNYYPDQETKHPQHPRNPCYSSF